MFIFVGTQSDGVCSAEKKYTQEFVQPGTSLTLDEQRNNYLSWFSSVNGSNDFEVCFVKILIHNSVNEYIEIESLLGEYNNPSLNLTAGESSYGTHTSCLEPDSLLQATCVEVKHPGEVSHHNPTPFNETYWDKDSTKVKITVKDSYTNRLTCLVNHTNANLRDANQVINSSLSFVLNDGEFYGNKFGVYCVTAEQNYEEVRTAALYQCMSETNQIIRDPHRLPTSALTEHFAVQFDCQYGNRFKFSLSHKSYA